MEPRSRNVSSPTYNWPADPLPPVSVLLQQLGDAGLLLMEDWENLKPAVREEIQACDSSEALLARLVAENLLTEFQALRIKTGTLFGMVLGNYRVLDRLGSGGMGVVYKGEHILMRRPVAIKVLPEYLRGESLVTARFATEIRAAARLHHPNVVAALDAGHAVHPQNPAQVIPYFVMEYLEGTDLENCVRQQGPLPINKACNWIYQIASALDAAHKHQLVHRDIKPSNILITVEDQAKLLDFGLARMVRQQRLTHSGMTLGTVDYMAPEQVQDASAVDIRADIYALGGTLFWCLAGRVPFPSQAHVSQDLIQRLTQHPPSLAAIRSDVPPELDAIVQRMMALKPAERYANPQAVMRVLLPFLPAVIPERMVTAPRPHLEPNNAASGEVPLTAVPPRVLIVDDEEANRLMLTTALREHDITCDTARHGQEALEKLHGQACDLVLLDVDMPVMNGTETLRKLRESPPCANLKIIMISGHTSADELAQLLLAGADDFLSKPFSLVQICSRVKMALRLKNAQDRSDALNRNLLALNSELERLLSIRDLSLQHIRNALTMTVAALVARGTNETEEHVVRLQRYCRILAEEASALPSFRAQITPEFIQTLECCVPLHDIGNVALPDHILHKAGKLDAEERLIMQSHAVIGGDILLRIIHKYGVAVSFLHVAHDITRHHHECHDGSGYPDRLSGSDIPLSARLVALADVYDALRSQRSYRPALAHVSAVQIMTEAGASKFDPGLLEVFRSCAPRWEQVHAEVPDA
ncbi:MAG: protein kinase domain-containing protein [Gemmataceae bacterium]